MNLEEWAIGVKLAGSKKGKTYIKSVIKECCLLTPQKYMGAYQIDGEKVWDILIKNDLNCKCVCEKKNYHCSMDIESAVLEMQYHAFWNDNRRAYGKKRR